MTKLEMRKILKGKMIYITEKRTEAASKLKFYVTYKNELINITHELAMFAGYKLTNDREIRETVGGSSRIHEVLYHAWCNVRGKKDSPIIGFRYDCL